MSHTGLIIHMAAAELIGFLNSFTLTLSTFFLLPSSAPWSH